MISTADSGLEKESNFAQINFSMSGQIALVAAGLPSIVMEVTAVTPRSQGTPRFSSLVPRFLCSLCRLTISILPAYLLPYRHIHVNRFEAFADRQAGLGQKPDPPPDEPDAAALRRAWARFAMRLAALRFCSAIKGHIPTDQFDPLPTKHREAAQAARGGGRKEWLAAQSRVQVLWGVDGL